MNSDRRGTGIQSLCASLFLAMLASCGSVEEPSLAPSWTAERGAEPLSHDDCVLLAVRSAPTAASFRARLLSAHAALVQAGRLPNPVLSAGWEDFSLYPASSMDPLQTTLSLAVALDELLARPRRIAAAEYDLAGQQAEILADCASIASDVHQAYDNLVIARRRLSLQRELETLAKAQVDAAGRFVNSGLQPGLVIPQAEAELAAVRAKQAEAEASARALELEFAFALGFERPIPLTLSENPAPAARVQPDDLEVLLSEAAANRQEIVAASAHYQAERERLALEAERIRFLPTISGGPRFSDQHEKAVASLDVVLPIFDGGAAAESTQSAMLLQAAADLRSTAHRVAREVCTSQDRLNSAINFLDNHARDLSKRREALRLSTERLFAAGECDYDRLILARRDEVQARLSLLDAEAAASQARNDLDAALGRLIIPLKGAQPDAAEIP